MSYQFNTLEEAKRFMALLSANNFSYYVDYLPTYYRVTVRVLTRRKLVDKLVCEACR